MSVQKIDKWHHFKSLYEARIFPMTKHDEEKVCKVRYWSAFMALKY